MKALVRIVLLIGLILLIGFYSINTIRESSDTMIQYIQEVHDLIRAKDHDAALRTSQAMFQYWQTQSPQWEKLIDHTEVERIEISIERLLAYFEADDEQSILPELAELRFAIEHLYRRQLLSWENIL